MTLKRGPFLMACDEPGCSEVVGLETENFDEACSLKMEEPEWGHYAHGSRGFKDYCPEHNPLRNE